MLKSLTRRAISLMLFSALVGAVSGGFHPTTVHGQGGFEYMCNAWEETCDDGSGDYGGGGGGGGGTSYTCPSPQWCSNLGCHAKSISDHTQICTQSKNDDSPFTCPTPINCVSR